MNDLLKGNKNVHVKKEPKLFTYIDGVLTPVELFEWIHEGKEVGEYIKEREELLEMKEQYELAQEPHIVFTLNGRTILDAVNVPKKGYITKSMNLPKEIGTQAYKATPFYELDKNDEIVKNEQKHKKFKMGGLL